MSSRINATKAQYVQFYHAFNALWQSIDARNMLVNSIEATRLIPIAIPDSWHNGAGYLDGARSAPTGANVTQCLFGKIQADGRRVLIMPITTDSVNGVRNLVIHDRYGSDDVSNSRVVFDFTSVMYPLGRWLPGEQMSDMLEVWGAAALTKLEEFRDGLIRAGLVKEMPAI